MAEIQILDSMAEIQIKQEPEDPEEVTRGAGQSAQGEEEDDDDVIYVDTETTIKYLTGL